MPIIGPIIGAVARAAATRGGAAVSASQFARGASMLNKVSKVGKVGKVGKLGRGALLMSSFSGLGSSGSASSGLSSFPQPSEPAKKQGLDTYGDGIY